MVVRKWAPGFFFPLFFHSNRLLKYLVLKDCQGIKRKAYACKKKKKTLGIKKLRNASPFPNSPLRQIFKSTCFILNRIILSGIFAVRGGH